MSRNRPHLPIRRRFFLGCEGESERSYGKLLQILADEEPRRYIHLDCHVVGGGDPLAIVEASHRKLKEQSHNHGPYVKWAILLDSDRIGQSPERDILAQEKAQEKGFLLIWQQPCHEAFLLHHFSDRQAHKPPDCKAAHSDLTKAFPTYKKPMPANRLRSAFQCSDVISAALIEKELGMLLDWLGFLD
ncbi:MAG: RloB domain-containing protein [Leptospirales bacterium]